MRIRINPLVIFRIIMWTCFTISVTFFGFTIFAIVTPMFGKVQSIFIFTFAFVFAVFLIGALLCNNKIHEQKRFLNQLKIENTYTLGEASLFFNLDAFKLRVNNLSRLRTHASRKQYVIAFTPTALDITSNRGRDKLMTSLNLKLAKFLDNLFVDSDGGSVFSRKHTVYAFSRGVFFFCVFQNDESNVHKLMDHISNECFRMVNEDKIKIWVQPFFGIKVMEKDESIVSGIEDALIARDHSEKNYESFTYFKDDFREHVSGTSVDIAKALDNNEFVAYYQPKYSLTEKKYVSSEALARWNSPEYGLLGPNKFIDEAEKAGLLNAIDTRIFEIAVKDLSEDIKRGRNVLPVSVNFSLYEFFSRNFLNFIMDTLKKYQVPPHLLEIEITETTSQVNKFLSLSVIKKLKGFGIRVLMDDFGQGYSQIQNLRQIPFDAIKIDKSFTDKITTDEKTRSIFKYLVELGKVNDMEVIVEGAETKEQIDILRKMHVDTVQGFYYSRPLSIDQYNELLKTNGEKHKKGAK